MLTWHANELPHAGADVAHVAQGIAVVCVALDDATLDNAVAELRAAYPDVEFRVRCGPRCSTSRSARLSPQPRPIRTVTTFVHHDQ